MRGALAHLFGLLLSFTVLALALPGPAAAWQANQFNAAQESLLLSLTNQSRAAAGVAPLRLNSSLRSLARWRSQDMEDRGYFAHEIPPDGRMVFSYMDQRRIKYVMAGENIGWDDAPDNEATQVIHEMFMDSSGHRANILNPRFDSIGIGAYKGSDGHVMYTVLFMQSRKKAAIDAGFVLLARTDGDRCGPVPCPAFAGWTGPDIAPGPATAWDMSTARADASSMTTARDRPRTATA